MATPAAVEARSLFRALLRVQKRWPAQPDRPGRNIKDAMASRVRASFSNVRTRMAVHSHVSSMRQPSTSEADLTSRLQYGRQQLEALKSLQSNEFATKVRFGS